MPVVKFFARLDLEQICEGTNDARPFLDGHYLKCIMQLESHKNRYPFRLSAPSFIFPADWVTNVIRLGPYVDEIELLFLESAPQSWPSKADVSELVRLAGDLDISYNIHLPTDIDFSSPEAGHSVLEPLSTLIGRIRPLDATTHTLHLALNRSEVTPGSIQAWQQKNIRRLARLLRLADLDAGQISVETLDYPPAWFHPVIDALNLSVCVDVGHVIRYGFDLPWILSTYASRMSIIHLHGVAGSRDHLSLSYLGQAAWQHLRSYAEDFNGTISLEVFTPQRLKESMDRLAALMGS